MRPDQKLILIGVPEVPRFEIFDCLSANQSMFDFVKQKCPATKQRTISHINRKLKQLAKEQDSVVFLNPKDILCSDETCQLQKKHKPLFQDTGHLSVYGAEKIVPHIVKLLQK